MNSKQHSNDLLQTAIRTGINECTDSSEQKGRTPDCIRYRKNHVERVRLLCPSGIIRMIHLIQCYLFQHAFVLNILYHLFYASFAKKGHHLLGLSLNLTSNKKRIKCRRQVFWSHVLLSPNVFICDNESLAEGLRCVQPDSGVLFHSSRDLPCDGCRACVQSTGDRR